MEDTCCCSHDIAEHTPHLLRCTVEWCNCQRFHTSDDLTGHDEERKLAAELEKEKAELDDSSKTNPLCRCGHRMLVHRQEGKFISYCFNITCYCYGYEEDDTMHDTPNPGKLDEHGMKLQRTVTYNFEAGPGNPAYALFTSFPDVHTITLETDESVTTYTRVEEENEG